MEIETKRLGKKKKILNNRHISRITRPRHNPNNRKKPILEGDL